MLDQWLQSSMVDVVQQHVAHRLAGGWPTRPELQFVPMQFCAERRLPTHHARFALQETGLNIALIVVSACELMALFYAYQNRLVKWESLWIIFVEVPPPSYLRSPRALSELRDLSSPSLPLPQLFHYTATVVVPESEFVTFELTNGTKLPWLLYFSWLVTVPVLLMYLVSLTVHGGRAATVPLVPLLVSSLIMVLLGVTAAACSPPLKWGVFGIGCCFGGMVLAPMRSRAHPALATAPLPGWLCHCAPTMVLRSCAQLLERRPPSTCTPQQTQRAHVHVTCYLLPAGLRLGRPVLAIALPDRTRPRLRKGCGALPRGRRR